MDEKVALETYQLEYNKVGIKIPTQMVDALTENKHGIDNPVTDLNIGAYLLPIQQQIAALQTLNRAAINNGEVVVDDDQIIYI